MGQIKNLSGVCKVTPGTGVTVLIIAANDLLNEPRTLDITGPIGADATPPVPYTAKAGDKVVLGEAFTYVPGAKFAKFVVVPDSGQVTADSVGDRGFEAYENGFKGMVKGIGAAQREWAESITDSCGGAIVLVQNRKGDWDKLGSKISPVTVKFKFDSGQKAGDKQGVELEVKDTSGLIYRTMPSTLLDVATEVLAD